MSFATKMSWELNSHKNMSKKFKEFILGVRILHHDEVNSDTGQLEGNWEEG